jgi:hypothetical protein
MVAPSGRVYSKYDLAYSRRPAIKHRHAEQVKARRWAIKKWGKEAVKGKDIDHILALKGGGSTTMKNIRIRSIHANRADKTFFN